MARLPLNNKDSFEVCWTIALDGNLFRPDLMEKDLIANKALIREAFVAGVLGELDAWWARTENREDLSQLQKDVLDCSIFLVRRLLAIRKNLVKSGLFR